MHMHMQHIAAVNKSRESPATQKKVKVKVPYGLWIYNLD